MFLSRGLLCRYARPAMEADNLNVPNATAPEILPALPAAGLAKYRKTKPRRHAPFAMAGARYYVNNATAQAAVFVLSAMVPAPFPDSYFRLQKPTPCPTEALP